jgi:GrpB protein
VQGSARSVCLSMYASMDQRDDMPDLDDLLRARLRAAGVDLPALFGRDLDPWQVWLFLREHLGRRATLVDLYELEAASRGMRPEELTAADREHLKVISRRARRRFVQAEVLPGSARPGDPHEVTSYDHAWQEGFAIWRDRLTAVLGAAATRIDHVGSTAVPGLAAKPVIDIQVSVPDVADERSYLPLLESAGLILRLRETGHLFLWPPPAAPRDVHVHVCASGSSWERIHLGSRAMPAR